MNWTVLLIQMLIIMVAFTCMVAIPLTINPVSFISDYPPEIQAEYYKTHEEKKEKLTAAMIIKKLVFCILALFLCAWMAHMAGAETFLQGSLTGLSYILVIGAYDTFILDWIFFARIKKWRLPGTEHMDKEYKQKWFHLKGVLKVAPLGIIAGLLIGLVMIWIF